MDMFKIFKKLCHVSGFDGVMKTASSCLQLITKKKGVNLIGGDVVLSEQQSYFTINTVNIITIGN